MPAGVIQILARFRLAPRPGRAYVGRMTQPKRDTTDCEPTAPAAWSEVLAESEAEHAAGLVVSGDDVLRELRDSLVRLDEPEARGPALHRAR